MFLPELNIFGILVYCNYDNIATNILYICYTCFGCSSPIIISCQKNCWCELKTTISNLFKWTILQKWNDDDVNRVNFRNKCYFHFTFLECWRFLWLVFIQAKEFAMRNTKIMRNAKNVKKNLVLRLKEGEGHRSKSFNCERCYKLGREGPFSKISKDVKKWRIYFQ